MGTSKEVKPGSLESYAGFILDPRKAATLLIWLGKVQGAYILFGSVFTTKFLVKRTSKANSLSLKTRTGRSNCKPKSSGEVWL